MCARWRAPPGAPRSPPRLDHSGSRRPSVPRAGGRARRRAGASAKRRARAYWAAASRWACSAAACSAAAIANSSTASRSPAASAWCASRARSRSHSALRAAPPGRGRAGAGGGAARWPPGWPRGPVRGGRRAHRRWPAASHGRCTRRLRRGPARRRSARGPASIVEPITAATSRTARASGESRAARARMASPTVAGTVSPSAARTSVRKNGLPPVSRCRAAASRPLPAASALHRLFRQGRHG